MAKLSKYVNVDKNVLLEYIYDDDNNIGESYDILVNSRERKQSYLANSTSGTNNTQNNSLFVLDKVANKFGKINPAQYSFLQIRNYSSATPIAHDRLVVHLPINWTFGEYLGFYVRIFAYDVLNQTSYELSNFYFDMTDSSQGYLMNFTSPPLLFKEKLWGKNITIDFPAVSAISAQRVNNRPKTNSINANLTNGSGLSMTTPVFIDFQFINNIQTINAVSTYLLNPKISISVPQTPEFENLGLKIEHSKNGDFFEIYGTYNGTIAGFKQFIDDSFISGARYYVQYSITIFEQNIRGKTITAEVTDNFNETIEFRPIIKSSTTTAIIDVEMKLVDAVTESTIVRRASYGMLQDEVSRYSLNLIKINLANANKPKIYNTKLSRPVETKAIEERILSIKNKNRGLAPIKNKISNAGFQNLQSDPRLTGLVSNAVRDFAESGMNSDTDLNRVIQKVTSEVLKNLSGTANSVGSSTIPISKTEYQFFDRIEVSVLAAERLTEVNNPKYEPQGQAKIIIDMIPDVISSFNFKIVKDAAGSISFDLSAFDDLLLVFSDGKSAEKVPQYKYFTTTNGTANSSNAKEGLIYFEINNNNKQVIRDFYNSGNKNYNIVGVSNGRETSIYRGIYELSDSKTMTIFNDNLINQKLAQEKEIALNAKNPKPQSETKQDPSVNAPSSTTSNAENLGNDPKKKG